MYKIAISGKAGSGKDTLAKLLRDHLDTDNCNTKILALADPVKDIVKIMFPRTEDYILYGPSKNRALIVPGVFKNDAPLTYRKLLQEIGTEVGRSYNQSIWLNVLDYKLEMAEKNGNIKLFVVSDVRFKNEFDHLKQCGYTMIRIFRNLDSDLDHSSETEQNSINDDLFDYVIDNNNSIEQLKSVSNDIANDIAK
ncbi:hypothetical protein UFOVP1290_571 [uncultured Caudovirales phage]|uniref:Uncharacterized protein n=1 Tax=uncultured Caudovirales phage TaxID=2100421 RepID=A0A6J5RU16_9CAUD|nr:hypothetical protein UFOVP1290_571 [uncultured Caudovirales phage]